MSYNLLKGKRGIIFGALNEQSIAWKVAERAVEEGAVITLSNTPVAVRMGQVSALSEKLNCEVIAADATNVEDLENVFKRSMEVLGGQIDFVLHSIGMSPNVRKKRTYDDLDYNMLNTTLDVSAVSFHKMIQAAKKQNAIAEYGSIVALSYVAAQRTFYGYNDMADAKALLESIARSLGSIYGREHNVRVNTISQSPTFTTAGSGVKGMDKLYDFANRMSPLGNASADECADYCIVMFSDLTRKVTMQNLFHDGGFSSVGMSLRAMATYEKGRNSDGCTLSRLCNKFLCKLIAAVAEGFFNLARLQREQGAEGLTVIQSLRCVAVVCQNILLYKTLLVKSVSQLKVVHYLRNIQLVHY